MPLVDRRWLRPPKPEVSRLRGKRLGHGAGVG
jgi:hypothetical protein